MKEESKKYKRKQNIENKQILKLIKNIKQHPHNYDIGYTYDEISDWLDEVYVKYADDYTVMIKENEAEFICQICIQ